ncbi:hypothetical protein [Pseudodesulfovibrio pelocollis]|uniref:hypothetical protein n=1 Tax=Pseudodesulfovibrio pelocollis TaxID=3051432 RepID=UPI00255AD3E3|nr:hypothetical protein [Pseudodesulfovibrio sp. SB368]
MSQPRGSFKHVLDLLDSGRFAAAMTGLLGGHGVRVGQGDARRPLGHDDPDEWTLEHFCGEHCRELFDCHGFASWWNISGGKRPTWDILATCTIHGDPGLLLVEAKANDRELDWNGKAEPDQANPRALENHRIIGQCIDEANTALNRHIPGFAISRDTHYQLSNRIASAWKLAECGLPVALLYLGFTGDEGLRTATRHPLADRDHWQRLMGAYLHGTVPHHFPGTVIHGSGKATMRMLIEALPVMEISPPAQEH